MSGNELPRGVNLLQHGPAGEHPAGYHPSTQWDPLLHQRDGKALYSRYVRPGDLVFDIGANVGQRTGWFLELGCRVVAVEPLAHLLAHADPGAVRVAAACGAKEGTQTFWHCTSSTYLSTLSLDYMEKVYEQPGIGGNIYSETSVPVVTLDGLIAEHGEPDFVKIDVEGGELEVFAGLTHPLKALSFEVHKFDPAKAQACIDYLATLGRYSYEYSPLETFVMEPWPPREWAIFGDVYAVRRGGDAP